MVTEYDLIIKDRLSELNEYFKLVQGDYTIQAPFDQLIDEELSIEFIEDMSHVFRKTSYMMISVGRYKDKLFLLKFRASKGLLCYKLISATPTTKMDLLKDFEDITFGF